DPDQSIAILVRSRSHLREIVPALRAAGLRWNASKIDRLLAYPDIADLFTLLRALLTLADTTAWLALLRTPFVGLLLDDVHTLAAQAQAESASLWTVMQRHAGIAALSSDAHARLERCVPLLQQARARRQLQPLRQVLEALWIALGGPACLPNAALQPNVATFFRLVGEHAPHGDVADIHALAEALDATYGSAVDESIKLQLMTIHNAKGLEFDVVLVPGLDRLPRANDRELLLWHEQLDAHNRSRPLLALLPEKGQPEDLLYEYLRYEREQRDLLEATRLLYIAVTRAVRSAWLFGYVKTAKDGGIKSASASLLQRILPVLEERLDELQVQLEPLQAAPPAEEARELLRVDNQPLRRLPAQWRNPVTRALWQPQPPAVEDDPLHEQLLARSIGELVHQGLKHTVERGPAWLPQDSDPPLWRRTLAPLCANAEALAAALASVRMQLRNCIEHPELRWLFTERQRDDACELPLVSYTGGYRRDHVVDRTFIDANGTRWIIDYKSAAPGKDQDLDAFLQQQSALYRQQLLDYAALFSHDAQPLRLALLFTMLPALHLLET
ncbi:MAG: 3'-5' exonuclease, partial [Gammaproteobacteria bacterium]